MSLFGRNREDFGTTDPGTAISELSDVSLVAAAEGDVLMYDGSAWVDTALTVDNITNVVITSAATGQVLVNAGSTWVNVEPEALSFGSATGSTTFETAGVMTMAGSAQVWEDIIILTANLAQGAAAPTLSVSSNIRTWAFAGGVAGTADELHGSFEIPHNYAEGTDLSFHVHWFSVSAATGNVVMGIDYGVGHVGEAMAYTTAVTTVLRSVTTDEVGIHHIDSLVTISDANMDIGDVVTFRIYRPLIATNTHPDPIALPSIGVHYKMDTLGSRTMTAK